MTWLHNSFMSSYCSVHGKRDHCNSHICKTSLPLIFCSNNFGRARILCGEALLLSFSAWNSITHYVHKVFQWASPILNILILMFLSPSIGIRPIVSLSPLYLHQASGHMTILQVVVCTISARHMLEVLTHSSPPKYRGVTQ